MFRRILGAIILLISIITVVVLIAGAVFIGQLIDQMGAGVDNGLVLAVDTLSTVGATLEQTQATLVEVNDGMDTATLATTDLAKTLEDTIPLIEKVAVIVTEQAPQNIENVENAVPNMAQVAGVVDSTLTTLSNFGFDQSFVIPLPFGNDIEIPLAFDLGIEYEPVEPFDETVSRLGEGLDGLPEQLRSLESDLAVSAENLRIVSEDINMAAGNLESINEQVALFIPLLDQYLRIVDQIIDSLVQARGQIAAQLGTAKTIAAVAMVFLALTQLTPLYVGWELLTRQRPGQQSEQQVEAEPQAPAPAAAAAKETAEAPAADDPDATLVDTSAQGTEQSG